MQRDAVERSHRLSPRDLAAPGVAVQLAPGVEWLCMPLPFALNHINTWLLADGDGYAAVDTGFAQDPIKQAWKSALARRTAADGAPSSPTATPTTSAWPPGWSRKPAPGCGSPRANTSPRT
jgi:hypothetical protein